MMGQSSNAPFTLEDLDRVIQSRLTASAEKSYTKSLLDKGLVHCGKKFGEEAVEFVIATAQGEPGALTAEAADVLYHLLVALQAAQVPLENVLNELQRRTGMSGHEEKAARG
jgi:phosphoribosyl-ATP pyrophosphohydrolase